MASTSYLALDDLPENFLSITIKDSIVTSAQPLIKVVWSSCKSPLRDSLSRTVLRAKISIKKSKFKSHLSVSFFQQVALFILFIYCFIARHICASVATGRLLVSKVSHWLQTTPHLKAQSGGRALIVLDFDECSSILAQKPFKRPFSFLPWSLIVALAMAWASNCRRLPTIGHCVI